MALTRRSARFGELAAAIDERLLAADVDVAPAVVDVVLNEHVAQVAAFMGIGARTALSYAPDDLPDTVARSIVVATKALDHGLRRGHLRLVD